MAERTRTRRANGAGSITTRDDGALIVRVSIPGTGQRLKRIVVRETRDDGRPESDGQHRRRAERVLSELRTVATKPVTMREQWTVERWATERYLPSLSVAAGTHASYQDILRTTVFPHLGHIRLDRLTVDDVDRLDAVLVSRGLSMATRRHARGALGRVLRHAVRKRRIDLDVTSFADRLEPDNVDRAHNVIEPDQVRALLTAAKGTEWELPIALLGLLGLRRGEALGLGWDAVDLDAGTLSVRRNLTSVRGALALGTPKTAGSRRSLKLSPSLVALFRAHRARQTADRLAAGDRWTGTMTDHLGDTVALVITGGVGQPVTGARLARALQRHATLAGVGTITPHQLRHSAASVMLSEGMDVPAVSAVLGHASASVTMGTYAHAIGRTRSAATAAVADAVGSW